MAQTILTKFFGPTNTRGARVKATGWLGGMMAAWDYELSVEGNHKAAAQKYVDDLNRERQGDLQWKIIAFGSMPDSCGYAFIIDL